MTVSITLELCLQEVIFVESFAGTAMATYKVKSAFPSATTVALDKKYSETHDLSTDGGMACLHGKSGPPMIGIRVADIS